MAILAREPSLAVQGKGSYDHRMVAAIVPYTRKAAVHILNVYGWDRTYVDDALNAELQNRVQQEIQRIGRAPYVIGGDWNQTPEEVGATWMMGASRRV